MTETPAAPAHSAPVRVERESHRRYTGYSARGGVVHVGDESFPDTFTPGELLKVALGACAAMSSDAVLTRRLGEDYALSVTVDAEKNTEENRYAHFTEDFTLDLSAFDDATRSKILNIMERAIAQACTVGKTIAHGAASEHRFTTDGSSAAPFPAVEVSL